MDGFTAPRGKKRTRSASPKSKSHEIVSLNSFSVLEDAPVVKKQAVSKELKYEKNTSSPKGYQYEERSCRPKVPRSSSHDPKENQSVSEKRTLELTKKTDTTIPGHASNQKLDGSGSRKNRPSNTTTYYTKSGSSQSQNAKIGKRNNNLT